MNRENRTKVFYLLQGDLIGMLNGLARFEYVSIPLEGYNHHGWPPDAEVVTVWFDNARCSFGVLIRSAEFDIVPEGQASPDAQGEPIRWGLLKKRSLLETHEPVNAEVAQAISDVQATWRDRGPLL